jgi:hypothetical protein
MMTITGTISDFDRAGHFGLITADDGRLLLFNLRTTPPARRSRFDLGTRVKVTRYMSEPMPRAIEVAPIDGWNDGRSSSAATPGV